MKHKCECEFRDRAWNGFGRCLTCGNTYRDERKERPTHALQLKCELYTANPDWDGLQASVEKWADHNFPKTEVWQLAMGMFEEIGEYYTEMWSRTNDDEKVLDGIGDQFVYALNLCSKLGMKFSQVISGFRDRNSWPLIPEIGRVSHAILKHSQGIRGFDDNKRKEAIINFVRFWYSWLVYAAYKPRVVDVTVGMGKMGVDYSLWVIANMIWTQVSKRDWVKNPETGT